jgi:prepilin-type N-terminal cleavage/methylation domain-containing protein
MHKRTHKITGGERGFTLLEVAFVITIFAVMASVVLFRFKDFGAKTAFDNLSQDIALRIVQAQKSAISGALNPNFVGTGNPPAYGVYFKAGTGDAIADPMTFLRAAIVRSCLSSATNVFRLRLLRVGNIYRRSARLRSTEHMHVMARAEHLRIFLSSVRSLMPRSRSVIRLGGVRTRVT